jgi:hypothetical protein
LTWPIVGLGVRDRTVQVFSEESGRSGDAEVTKAGVSSVAICLYGS